jgi:hypothetical protein
MKKPSYAKRRLRGEQSSQKMQPEMIRDCLAGNTRGEHGSSDKLGETERSFGGHFSCNRPCPKALGQTPMKKISDLFTDEEKKQLSYLSSMLRREPTSEEQEQQQILDWFVDNKDRFKDGKLREPKED